MLFTVLYFITLIIYEFCLPFWLLIKLLVSTMSKSNLITNTGHRFISKGKTAFKIHIHTPDDTVLHRSVGFVRIGEKKGLKKAIKLRN